MYITLSQEAEEVVFGESYYVDRELSTIRCSRIFNVPLFSMLQQIMQFEDY